MIASPSWTIWNFEVENFHQTFDRRGYARLQDSLTVYRNELVLFDRRTEPVIEAKTEPNDN